MALSCTECGFLVVPQPAGLRPERYRRCLVCGRMVALEVGPSAREPGWHPAAVQAGEVPGRAHVAQPTGLRVR
jgi:hypothetical protein